MTSRCGAAYYSGSHAFCTEPLASPVADPVPVGARELIQEYEFAIRDTLRQKAQYLSEAEEIYWHR